MHRRDFTMGVPLAAAAALTIRRVAAQTSADLRASQSEAAKRMRREAVAFLAALSADQRRSTSFALDVNERTIWSNLPVAMVPRVGVALGDMGDVPRQRLHALLRASSSSQGYLKMTGAMRHDQVLHDMAAGAPGRRIGNAIIDSFGASNFFTAIFGDPAHEENWGWLITGHHLGATFTVAGSRVTFMPLFLGAQPDLIETGPYAGEKVLGHEASRAQELLRSLSTQQRTAAVLSTRSFRDVVAGPGRRESLTCYEGIPAPARSVAASNPCCGRSLRNTSAMRTSSRPPPSWTRSRPPGSARYTSPGADR